MSKISFEGQKYETESNESVLDCLARHGVSVKSSCKAGVCQSCMMVAHEGEPPEKSQAGLKSVLKAQNYFLACACVPKNDIHVGLPDKNLVEIETTIQAVDQLNTEVVRLRLVRPENYEYYPGQYLTLTNPHDVSRSYSIASVPAKEEFVELHIRRVPDGQMSGWAHTEAKTGDTVHISQSHGECFYIQNDPQQPLLLVGTGCGLAPLYGIIKEALRQGHSGPIHLYHGSRTLSGQLTSNGLYLVDELRNLEQSCDQFYYHPCISRGHVPENMRHGRANDMALEDHKDLTGWAVYLCGQEDMVKTTKTKAYLAGANLQNIYADPFIVTPSC